ncbi:MAG TPA: glycosyltransferase family 4 protein [Thermosynechococcaceae cyanobacterium]
MKITFVLPHADLSGGIRVAAIYADRLKKRGHDVFVVSTPRSDLSLPQKLKGVLKGLGWVTLPKRSPSHMDTVAVKHSVLEKARPVTDADVPDADVIIATWWETAEWVAALSPSKGVKAYFIQHYEAFDYVPKGRVEATWTLPMHKIVVADWLGKIAENLYQDSSASIVPNGVDPQVFFAAPRGKQKTPTIGMVYTSPSWKGCDICLEAYALAVQKVPNLRLVAFGGKLVDHLPLPDGVEYMQSPPQDKIRELYAQCDAWLFGSRSEGYGLPILEAMACRTPVIGAPTGAAPELLANKAGILVKPEDPRDMAEAIVKICQMPEAEWQSLSDRAYAVARLHTWDEAVERFEAALKQAINHDKGN